MAVQKIIEIVAKTEEATKDIKKLFNEQLDLTKKAQKEQNKLNDEVADIGKATKGSEKGLKSLANGFKGVGLAVKTLGIGLLLEGFSLLKDLFSQNQVVADAFGTAFQFVSIAFNDFITFIFDNSSGVIDFFKAIFENPLDSVKNLGKLIRENLIERFNSLLEVAGFLGDAIGKLFEGDFTGAFESVKKAGKESIDVFTGVDDSFNKVGDTINKVVDSATEYTKATFRQAKANVELKNTAELAVAEQSRLIEIYDRQAEKLRQIRDNDLIGIEERKKANEDLNAVLDKQEKALIKQANLQIASAQANLSTNNSIENQVALTDALANREGVLAQIEGLRSEQLANRNALKREEIELDNSIKEGEKERRLAQLQFDEEQATTEDAKLEKMRLRLEEERNILLADIESKREIYKEGTQARVDAENEFLLKSQEIDNQLKVNAQNLTEFKKRKDDEDEQNNRAVANAKLGIAKNLSGLIQQIAGEDSKVGKALAIGQATISGIEGVQNAYKTAQDSPITGFFPAYPIIQAGLAGAFSALQIAKIKSTNVSGKGASGGSANVGGQPQAPSTPSFNLIEGSGTNQIAESIQGGNEPIQAFVVSSEVSNAQSLDRNIIDEASV